MSSKHALYIRAMEPRDLDELFAIRQLAYLDTSDFADPAIRAHHLQRLPYQDGCFIEGKLASSASWVPFGVTMYGRAHEAIGLASVLTSLEHRRMGCVRALLGHGLRRAHEQGVAWCFEHPFDTRYYSKYGWAAISSGLFFNVPVDRFPCAHASPMRRLPHDQAETVEVLRGIHAAYAARYNFMMLRDGKARPEWTSMLQGTPWHPKPHTLVWASQAAYVILELERGAGQRARVLDWAHSSPEGRAHIFELLGLLKGQAQEVTLQLAMDDPLISEWSNFCCPHPDPLQARIVDVVAALELVRSRRAISLVLDITDDFCPWNHGRFKVAVTPESAQASACEEPADLMVDIRKLAKILSGSLPVHTAHANGLISGDAVHIDALSQLDLGLPHLPHADYF